MLAVAVDAGQAVSTPSPNGSRPSATLTAHTGHPNGSSVGKNQRPRPDLKATLDKQLGSRRGDVSAYAVDLRTGQTVHYGQGSGMATASMVKLDILLTFLLQEQREGTMPSSAETALATQMIYNSDNDAASDLWSEIGAGSGISAANHRFGLSATTPDPAGYWGATTTSAADQVRLMRLVLEPNKLLSDASRAYALKLLEGVEPDQRWGVSAANDRGPADQALALKNGWLPRSVDGGRWVVNSVGRVTAAGDPVVLAVLTRRSTTIDNGIALVETTAKAMRNSLVGTPVPPG